MDDTRGSAAAEMAIWATVLIVPVLSVVDLGVYAFQKMQVESAAQGAVAAVWRFCDTAGELPAVQNCTSLLTNMNAGAQNTSLGATVTVTGVTEGYYCRNGAGDLQLVGTTAAIGGTPTKPSPFNCSAAGSATTVPGDYIQATASYTYSPVFTGISITTLLPTAVTRTAWMRLG
ncbi:TadE family protein [Phenylobacterium sp.]|uniref:TadE/TadG family type IV pilus assembly protein n=1 Tax=Phenylobacterium sp. TaxID=1871053 RepID=UPI002F4135F6